MNIELVLYGGEQEKAVSLVKEFWLNHNNYIQTEEEALKDLSAWTGVGHKFYFIAYDGIEVGFVHLGSRGAKADWLEDLYVQPSYQNRGIGSKAIELTENLVKEYSMSLYIEAAARNEKAIRLYRRLGYDCLNSITIRKDFKVDDFECIREEKIYNNDFEIRKLK